VRASWRLPCGRGPAYRAHLVADFQKPGQAFAAGFFRQHERLEVERAEALPHTARGAKVRNAAFGRYAGTGKHHDAVCPLDEACKRALFGVQVIHHHIKSRLEAQA
jgi:hypothetical protein